MTTENNAWLAAYLYYAEPWETFLTDAVKPFVEKVMAEPGAEQFFFVRYWERGPHIRLRFMGEAQWLEHRVKPALTSYFTDYFQRQPTVRSTPAWVSNMPATQQWFPNNSIQFIPYEPETERYGGPVGMRLAERQFECSSRVVLATLAASYHWDYNRALGAAIQLHLLFAYAMDMTPDEIATFFTHVYTCWAPHAYVSPEGASPAEESLKASRPVIEKAFEDAFTKQKTILIPFIQTVLETLQHGQAFEQEPLNQWVDDMRATHADLQKAQAEQWLRLPSGVSQWLSNKQDAPNPPQMTRLFLLESYVHMLNNRLGICNRDEGYIGFILKESLADIVLTKTTI